VPLDSTSVTSGDFLEDFEKFEEFEDFESNVDSNYMQHTGSWKQQVHVMLLRFGDYVQTRRLPSPHMLWAFIPNAFEHEFL